MNYNDIYNKLNNGQEAFISTCFKTGTVTITDSAEVGLFDTHLVEHFKPYPQLVLLGAGHVSAAVCKVCAELGFKITVVDEREKFANKINFPKANKIIVSAFDEFLSTYEGGDGVYYAVLTRGHLQDRLCLEYILKKPYTYVGMIGSKRKNKMVFDELLKSGYDKSTLSQVNAPIGIDICAQTPEEIAISIAAQLVLVRSKQNGSATFDEAVLKCICSQSAVAMATICKKSGSAPRGVGAKMALLKNGKIVGTIGGGSAEAQVIELMQCLSSNLPVLTEIEMSNENAEKEGLICGGKISVLICKL